MTIREILKLNGTIKSITDKNLSDWCYANDSSLVLDESEFNRLDSTDLPFIEVREYYNQWIDSDSVVTLYAIYYLATPTVLVYQEGDDESTWTEERYILHKQSFHDMVKYIHGKLPAPIVYETNLDFEIKDFVLV